MIKNSLLKIAMICFIFAIFSSCSENIEEPQQSIDLSNLDLSGLKIGVNPVSIDLNEYPLNQLLEDIGNELEEADMDKVAKNMKLEAGKEPFVGVNILINRENNTAFIMPLEGSIETPSKGSKVNLVDDSTKCGGAEGDGWKSYGTCFTSGCVSNTMVEAADDLGDPLPCQCLDLRVVRTSIARVCGRMISCPV
ncbi:hypothetical protein [Algoriphagus persicinus]|uniref:hypothetical protein n=1 Tax=Algoriphagus persicinus TaxID=3108754 RepID=UPI002B3D9712|nr:hypothetical protein [Algoriphagus sp. E1-3-M2]MEB2786670.1 hypothetical protein [Algoriphagus sp. E1-3-M2]